MTTLSASAKFATDSGFTHILAADGTTTPLQKLQGVKKRGNFQFIGGYGYVITIPAKRGYYELIAIINGYTARYNPLFNRFIASHDEIGSGLGEFDTLQNFKKFAEKG